MKTYIFIIIVFFLSYYSNGQSHFTISNSTIFESNAGVYINFSDIQLIVNGTFNGNNNSTVEIKGTASSENSKIGGSGTISFNNLTINKSLNEAQLDNNILVNNHLNLNSGKLNIRNKNIDLGLNGTLINETNSTRIYGTTGLITASNRSIIQNTTLNVANMGGVITPHGNTITNLSITRGVSPQLIDSKYSINRFYDIVTTPSSGLNADFTINYFDDEFNDSYGGLNETEYKMWSSIDNGLNWETKNASPEPSSNSITYSGIDQFKKWTVKENSTVLPITLINFDVEKSENSVILSWETASEINNDYYQIERSTESIDWHQIATVKGKGSSNNIQIFQVSDINPFDGINYYRLKQFDFDGKFTITEIRKVYFGKSNNDLNIYPNPAINEIFIESDNINKSIISIYNSSGAKTSINQLIEPQKITINTTDLDSGVYFLKIIGFSDTRFYKIVINK